MLGAGNVLETAEVTDYPNVKNAHIVPRTYLENFASDGKIGVRIDSNSTSLVLPVEKVGTRRRFYRRERPTDGRLFCGGWRTNRRRLATTRKRTSECQRR
jgi:hypothetical protein